MHYCTRWSAQCVWTVASLFVGGLLMPVFFPSKACAHEPGAPFSSAIIDPVVTHHAHIENE